MISPEVGENAALLDSFVKRIVALNTSGDLLSISISGYASPEGPLELNQRLALRRCEAVASYILKHSAIDPQLISIKPGGIAWDELRHLVMTSDRLGARRDEILQILDSPGLSGNERLSRMKQVGGGEAYEWMLQALFPGLRYAKAVAIFRQQEGARAQGITTAADTAASPYAHVAPDPEVAETDTVWGHISVYPDVPSEAQENDGDRTYRHLLALKTNLLFYGVLMPNLSLEWLITGKWSVAVEGNMAWWSNESKFKCYRVATVDAEGRYWIKPRDYWHGFYVGVFAGAGLYDLENGGNGHRGEGAMAGATVGYMWPIRHNLSFEVGVGGGYLYSRDKEYKPFEGHYVYQRSKSINYFGPLKLKFSFVWRFLDRNKSRQKGGQK